MYQYGNLSPGFIPEEFSSATSVANNFVSPTFGFRRQLVATGLGANLILVIGHVEGTFRPRYADLAPRLVNRLK